MDALDKKILSSHYIAEVTKKDVKDILKKLHYTEEQIFSKIESLKNSGLLEKTTQRISVEGISSLKIVLAGGVFDIIHPGHIHTLNAAKKLGDVLAVVIATDNTAVKMKKRRPLHDQEQRKMLVDALEIVDVSVIGHEGDIFKTVDLIKPQIIALGYDQVHQEKYILDGCKKIKLQVTVARLQSPIPDISSSIIEKEYGDAIHDT